jgi:hypothetical protein
MPPRGAGRWQRVYEVYPVPVGRARPRVPGDLQAVLADRFSGDAEPLLPFLGGGGGVFGVQQVRQAQPAPVVVPAPVAARRRWFRPPARPACDRRAAAASRTGRLLPAGRVGRVRPGSDHRAGQGRARRAGARTCAGQSRQKGNNARHSPNDGACMCPPRSGLMSSRGGAGDDEVHAPGDGDGLVGEAFEEPG